MLGQGCENRLPDPPHGVRYELHTLVGVELSGGSEQAQIALADKIGEAHTTILVLLGDRHDKSEVRPDQLVHRVGVARGDAARHQDLLLSVQERGLGDLEKILVENVAFTIEHAHARGAFPAGARGTRLFAHDTRMMLERNRLARVYATCESLTLSPARASLVGSSGAVRR